MKPVQATSKKEHTNSVKCLELNIKMIIRNSNKKKDL